MPQHELRWNKTVPISTTEERIGGYFREAKKELERLGGDLIRNKQFRHAVDQIDGENLYLTFVMRFDGILQPAVRQLQAEQMTPEQRRVAALKGMFH